MKVALVSDLHVEFDQHDRGDSFLARLESQLSGVDVLVVAGDTDVQFGLPRTLTRLAGMAPRCLAVIGNHECYRGTPRTVFGQIDSMQLPNLTVLDRTAVEIDGIRFVGTTLWPALDEHEQPYRCPMDTERMIRPWSWMPEFARLDQTFLLSRARAADVVVTHFAPHVRCTKSRWVGNPDNWYFTVEETGSIVEACGAQYWFYGHHHDPADLRIGTSQVICNPRGYPSEYRLRRPYEPVIVEVTPGRR